MSVASQKRRRFTFISAEGTGINQLEPTQECVEDAQLLSCSLLRNPWSITTGVFEHSREGENNFWILIFQGISF